MRSSRLEQAIRNALVPVRIEFQVAKLQARRVNWGRMLMMVRKTLKSQLSSPIYGRKS